MTAPTVGFTLIVKNGAENLRACLESGRGVASEMIVPSEPLAMHATAK